MFSFGAGWRRGNARANGDVTASASVCRFRAVDQVRQTSARARPHRSRSTGDTSWGRGFSETPEKGRALLLHSQLAIRQSARKNVIPEWAPHVAASVTEGSHLGDAVDLSPDGSWPAGRDAMKISPLFTCAFLTSLLACGGSDPGSKTPSSSTDNTTSGTMNDPAMTGTGTGGGSGTGMGPASGTGSTGSSPATPSSGSQPGGGSQYQQGSSSSSGSSMPPGSSTEPSMGSSSSGTTTSSGGTGGTTKKGGAGSTPKK